MARNRGERGAVSQYECLTGKGWQVTLNPDFTLSATVPPAQRSVYDADVDSCAKAFADREPPAAMTAARAKQLYALELRTVKCLEKEGVSQTREPISEQQYVDEYLSKGMPSWTAYEAVTDIGAVETKCPQPATVLPEP